MATTSSASGSTTFTGAISGLDTASIIQAMLAAEKAPLTRISSQRTQLKSTQSAFGQLRTMLSSLQSAAEAFSKSSTGSKRAASSSAPAVVTATASNGAVPSTYAVTVKHLATNTVATSQTAIGTAITAGDLGTTMSQLKLPGLVTGGSVGVVVDGKIVIATIGSPDTTTLGAALGEIANTIQAQMRTAGDAAATVSATIVDNKVQLTVSNTAAGHKVSFGAGGTTSNALGVLGLNGVTVDQAAGGGTISGKTSLGVISTSAVLDSAGLTGLAATATGVLTINGAAIAYDTTKDALSAIISRINSSAAGVTASLDRGNDKLVLTSRTGGAAPISIVDTSGTLAASLNLAPGTSNAQVTGTQAEVQVDGRTYMSDTNTLSNAVEGLTFTLAAEGSSTVTVSPDTGAVSSALTTLVNAYNDLAKNLETMTANDPKATKGSLAGEPDVRTMAMSLRQTLMSATSSSTSYSSLADIGISSGAVGSKVGTTTRLQLDATKLTNALQKDPSAVADLLNGASGALASIATTLKSWTTTGGRIDKRLESITTQLTGLDTRETQINDRVALRQAALEAKFSALEKTLAQMQTTTSSVTNQVNQMNKSG